MERLLASRFRVQSVLREPSARAAATDHTFRRIARFTCSSTSWPSSSSATRFTRAFLPAA